MQLNDALRSVSQLGVDTSSFIYYMESHPKYGNLCTNIFKRATDGKITVHTSIITLSEVLVFPLKTGDAALGTTDKEALQSAHLRAKYTLKTPDALQIATALESNCDAFLTNDIRLKFITEIQILVLDELTL